jgi:hypothetical protein
MEDETVKKKIATMLPVLDEKQTRLYLAGEAQCIGWGGQSRIAALSGKSRFLIARGAKELQSPDIQAPPNRIRRKDGQKC